MPYQKSKTKTYRTGSSPWKGESNPESSSLDSLTCIRQTSRKTLRPHTSSIDFPTRTSHLPYYTCLRWKQEERAESGQKEQRLLMGSRRSLDCALYWSCNVGTHKESTPEERRSICVHGGGGQIGMRHRLSYRDLAYNAQCVAQWILWYISQAELGHGPEPRNNGCP